jgi:hypothetical protein
MDKPRNHAFAEAARRWFSRPPEHLDPAERRVLEMIRHAGPVP